LASFWTFKTKVISGTIAIVVVLAGGIYAVNSYLDMRTKLAEQTAINSTNQDVMKKIGDALTASADVTSSKPALDAQAVKELGQQVVTYMASTKADIRALYTAMGVLAEQVKAGAAVKVDAGKDGSFKNVNLVEARPAGPALAEVNLNWDPTQTDASKRLSSSWTNYREDFTASLGEWQKKDNGYISAIAMHRDVYKADPTAPGGFAKIGTENIDMKDAHATYNQANFSTITVPQPRWNLILGGGKDNGAGKTVAAGILGYRMTDNIGVHLGQVGNTSILGIGYQFNLGK
jgi:FlaG/FlaF family flagellin (archaellin)